MRKYNLLKIIASGLVAALGVAGLSSCNSDPATTETDTNEYVSSSASTLVTGFSLRNNKKVLEHLDSVYFSIDQVKALIFNADSLPCGTDVSRMQVTITRSTDISKLEIIMPSRFSGRDTTVNIIANPNDSINFARGYVNLRVQAANSKAERVYKVSLNVHAINADSLQWHMTPSPLPGNPSAPRSHAAVELQGKYYSLTDGQVSVSSAPLLGEWTPVDSNLPASADASTLRASASSLYILVGGELWTSTDGQTWTATASTGWTWLYGGYTDQVVGVSNGKWQLYPSMVSGDLSEGMPVSGTSSLVEYTSSWNISPQALLVGGIDKAGNYSSNAWGFDGSNWAQLSGNMGNVRCLPPAEGYSLFPYFCYRNNKAQFYLTAKQSCWVALGGQRANGQMQDTVYVSTDNGINWRKAPAAMQLPKAMAPRSGASVLLATKTFGSRAVSPITSWDAPYILLTGGKNAQGQLFNQTWIGVINRLTFIPLQ